MKNKKIEVDKIVLDIRGKKVELSLDEAKELSELLKSLFPNPLEKIVYVPSYPTYPIVYRQPYPHWKYTLTCDNTSKSAITYSLTA